MKSLLTLAILTIVLLFSLSVMSQNQWITDTEMQYKIQVPNNYKQNQLYDGTDKILALVSPDENVAVRVRAMRATDGFTTELLQQVFEQNIISGANRVLNENGNLHGLPAKTAAYTWNFNNIETVIGAYYIVQNGFAYIVWSIVPRNLLQQRSAESDAITNSFELLKSSGTHGLSSLGNLSNTTSNTIILNNIELGSQVDHDLRITQASSFFPKNTFQINVGFTYSGKPQENSFQIKWFSKTHNKYINETTIDAPQQINGHGYGFISNQGNSWPTGNYRVEIWHQNKSLGAKEFQIN